MVSAAASGVATYKLTCANAAGSSPASSVSVTVTAAATHGGGGNLDWAMIIGLVLLSVAWRRDFAVTAALLCSRTSSALPPRGHKTLRRRI